VSRTLPIILPILWRLSRFCLSSGNPWTWTQKSVIEKSTSFKVHSDSYFFRTTCSSLKDQGRWSQTLRTSLSCWKENKMFFSRTATSTSKAVFQAFRMISFTTVLENTLDDRTLPSNMSLDFSLALGLASRTTGCLD
jgi:hypothetical protein